jgi:transposase
MNSLFANGNYKTINKVIRLRNEALHSKETRIALRLQGILLSLDGYTTGKISNLLKIHRSTVTTWVKNWNLYKENGLLEGHRTGRNKKLMNDKFEKLKDIIESGPVAYGLNTGIWTSIIIKQIIEEEFDIIYHPGHVRKILKQLGFSVQRPTIKLGNAEIKKKNKWIRYEYPNLKKKKKKKTE